MSTQEGAQTRTGTPGHKVPGNTTGPAIARAAWRLERFRLVQRWLEDLGLAAGVIRPFHGRAVTARRATLRGC
jgi:hypothetical protein